MQMNAVLPPLSTSLTFSFTLMFYVYGRVVRQKTEMPAMKTPKNLQELRAHLSKTDSSERALARRRGSFFALMLYMLKRISMLTDQK